MDTLSSPPALMIIMGLISALVTIATLAIKQVSDKRRPSTRDTFVVYLEGRVKVLEKRVDELEVILRQEQNTSERRRLKLLELSRLHNVDVDSLV